MCCGVCNVRVKVDIEMAKVELKKARAFAFGLRVSDDRAFPMRLLVRKGWKYDGGRLGKTTVTMVCPKCRPDDLVLDADVAG